MSDVLVFPDTRSAVFDLIDGAEHVGETVTAVYHLPADEYGVVDTSGAPVAHIMTEPGTQGYIDRKDRVTVDVYAPGEQAMETAQSIYASLVGDDIDTPSGYLDSVEADQTPHERPYQSDTLNQVEFRVIVTVRPV